MISHPFRAEIDEERGIIRFLDGYVMDPHNEYLGRNPKFSKGCRIIRPENMDVEFPYLETATYNLEVYQDFMLNEVKGFVYKARIVATGVDVDEKLTGGWRPDYVVPIFTNGRQVLTENLIVWDAAQLMSGAIFMEDYDPDSRVAYYRHLPNDIVDFGSHVTRIKEDTFELSVDLNDINPTVSYEVFYEVKINLAWKPPSSFSDYAKIALGLVVGCNEHDGEEPYDPVRDPVGSISEPWGLGDLDGDSGAISSSVKTRRYVNNQPLYPNGEGEEHGDITDNQPKSLTYRVIVARIYSDGRVEMLKEGGLYAIPDFTTGTEPNVYNVTINNIACSELTDGGYLFHSFVAGSPCEFLEAMGEIDHKWFIAELP